MADVSVSMIERAKRKYAQTSKYRIVEGNWRERLDDILHNYSVFSETVIDDADWLHGDPYEIANWLSLFTPIEEAIWSDVRALGATMWPQLPACGFFLDFGNPVLKIAIECDGAAFHNTRRDGARDAVLSRAGWSIVRIPGRECIEESIYQMRYVADLVDRRLEQVRANSRG